MQPKPSSKPKEVIPARRRGKKYKLYVADLRRVYRTVRRSVSIPDYELRAPDLISISADVEDNISWIS
jgi:hypothetical protein